MPWVSQHRLRDTAWSPFDGWYLISLISLLTLLIRRISYTQEAYIRSLPYTRWVRHRLYWLISLWRWATHSMIRFCTAALRAGSPLPNAKWLFAIDASILLSTFHYLSHTRRSAAARLTTMLYYHYFAWSRQPPSLKLVSLLRPTSLATMLLTRRRAFSRFQDKKRPISALNIFSDGWFSDDIRYRKRCFSRYFTWYMPISRWLHSGLTTPQHLMSGKMIPLHLIVIYIFDALPPLPHKCATQPSTIKFTPPIYLP